MVVLVLGYALDLSTVGYKRYPAYLTDHLLKGVCLLYRDWIGAQMFPTCFNKKYILLSCWTLHFKDKSDELKQFILNNVFNLRMIFIFRWRPLHSKAGYVFLFFWRVQIVIKDISKYLSVSFWLRNLKIGFNSEKIPQWQCITLHCLILIFECLSWV